VFRTNSAEEIRVDNVAAVFVSALIAFDGSPSAQLALAQAVDLAAAEHSRRLSLVTVVPPVSGFVALAGQSVEVLHTEAQHAADEQLRVASATIPSTVTHDMVRLEGPPGPAIVEQVERAGHDLVIMGSRGYGAIGSAVLGSVSTHVMRHSKVAVLVVHRPDD
jgi:nucleotide-binding universal stress UspA family protein